MNRFQHHTLGTLIVLLAGAAQAQEATPDTWLSEFRSQRSRAEVVAELMRARDSGEQALLTAEAHPFMPPRRGVVTVRLVQADDPAAHDDGFALRRETVVAALQMARANGELARLNGEAWDFLGAGSAPAPMTVAARR